MRSVLHLSVACLLTVLVAAAADEALPKPVVEDIVEPVPVVDKDTPEKIIPSEQKIESKLEIEETNNRKALEEPKPVKESAETKKPEEEDEVNQRVEKPPEEKVTYNGVKVLRVVVRNSKEKKMLRQLENKGDINTWSGNGTAVDILIKKDSVFDVLKDKNLVYDVIIDDLQKAIEEENPPISEDEWSELEGRKGPNSLYFLNQPGNKINIKNNGLVVEPYSQWIGNGFLGQFQNWLTNDFTRIVERVDYDDHFYGLRKMKRKKKKKNKKKPRGHRMTWQMYHRMADIHGYIDYLTATYPDMCSQETIGYSVEGRPLKVLKISSGEPNSRAIWVDSGIHAREWITPATSTYAISQMVENGDGTHGVDWYFLPLVNPDGYEHSHTTDRLWRKNRANPYKGPCAGTDLNRNFGYRWGGQGSSQQPCRETYAGSGPFSEPETNAINQFVTSKSNDLKAYISLHSYGQYILYPWGYDRKVPPDYSDLHRVGRSMAQAMRNSGGQIYRVGSAAATLYPASGGSDDWAKGVAKIKYTYTIELRDTGRHGFVLPAQYIQPTAKEAYAALKTLAYEVNQL